MQIRKLSTEEMTALTTTKTRKPASNGTRLANKAKFAEIVRQMEELGMYEIELGEFDKYNAIKRGLLVAAGDLGVHLSVTKPRKSNSIIYVHRLAEPAPKSNRGRRKNAGVVATPITKPATRNRKSKSA